jgi:hypothetical protein
MDLHFDHETGSTGKNDNKYTTTVLGMTVIANE